jgi:CheY-like chemotaxis protein
MAFFGRGAAAARRILVVEDDVDLRESVAQSLIEEGYSVEVAGDGRAALKALEKVGADLVLLDLMMPVMSGWEFRERQRSTPAFAHIPVVVMSATSTLEAAAIEAADLLPKPLSLGELLSMVRRHVGAPWVDDFDGVPKTEPNVPVVVEGEGKEDSRRH